MEKQVAQNPDIKIYVVCHKPSYVPQNPYLYPIQVGVALAEKKLPGMRYDDAGDNISDKIIAVLSFNTINPDSLKIISSSKDYSSNMRADIIRTSLFTTFANININRTNDCLTTSIEKANFLVLNKTKNDFKGYISVPKVIIS